MAAECSPKVLLFDVDNTLYGEECGVEAEMSRRIDRFVAAYLGVSEAASRELRRENLPRYGTSLRWLQLCHGLEEVGPYMEQVHPRNLEDYIPPNPRLRELLLSLPQELAILTNGPEFHARRVLRTLGIEELFPRLFALEQLSYQGKPHRSAYEHVLVEMGVGAEQVLFLDDKEVNLDAFHGMGGRGILVGPKARSERHPTIPTVMGLKEFLQSEVKG